MDIGARPPPELLRSLKGDPPGKNANPELKRIRKANLVEQARLLSMLEQFYRARECAVGDRIILAPRANGGSRLISQAAEVQDVLSTSRARVRLCALRKEMKDLAAFLQCRYVSQDG